MVSCRIFAKQFDQTGRLFYTCAYDAAWTMIFKRACRQEYSIRQQGRGQRIPFKAGIGRAVEFKFNGFVTIDQTTCLMSKRVLLHVLVTSFLAISWVTV